MNRRGFIKSLTALVAAPAALLSIFKRPKSKPVEVAKEDAWPWKDPRPVGYIEIWDTDSPIPDGWVVCDGRNGTTDMRAHFIKPGETFDYGVSGRPTEVRALKIIGFIQRIA